MKTFIYSTHGFDKPFLKDANKNNFDLKFTPLALNIDTASLCKGYTAVALFSSDDGSAPVIKKLSQNGIKYIALRSVGYDHIDLKKASDLGITVANVPEYSPFAIAEHGVAMLLALNRKLFEARALINKQDFRLDTLVGFDLNRKTVGVVGTGKIGITFAKIMNGFGCHLLGYDIVQNPQAKDLNLEYTSLKELIKRSDIVSLNCPLNTQTKYLINESQFELFKPGAILINTARGGVVNTKALVRSLDSGKLGGACLDVYEKEKGMFFFDHQNDTLDDDLFQRLCSFNNVIITGHQAFLTQEALSGIANTTFKNIDEWHLKGTSENDLNINN